MSVLLNMSQLPRQQTISRAVQLQGRGYWSGKRVNVEFRPAPVHSGVEFIRDDLPGSPRVAARVAHRIEVPRRTVLSRGKAKVDMVEHLLAALAGLAIDNCEIWVDAEEMPAFDGSSLEVTEALLAAGIEPQAAPAELLTVTQPLRVGDDDSCVEALPTDRRECLIQYDLDYGSWASIGRQSRALEIDPESFAGQLAAARTFVTEAEAAALREAKLGLHTTCQDLLVFGDDGPIDNTLRFADECVRHKMLDMVGDLALAGCRLIGRFHACRSGHRLNAELVKALLASNARRLSA